MQNWIVAEFDFKDLTTGSTVTVKATNCPTFSRSDFSYFPIIKTVSNLGVKMAEFIPEDSASSIILNDKRGTLGEGLRFSDYLDRYTLIKQEVRISIGQTTLTDFDPASDTTEVWRAVVSECRVSKSAGGETVTVSLVRAALPNYVATKEINLSQFPNCSGEFLGRVLPVVFGEDVQAVPIPVNNQEASGYTDFAYATTLGTQFKNGGVQRYLAKDHTGAYVPVLSAGTTTTAISPINKAFSTLVSGHVSSPAITSDEIAYGFTLSSGYLLSGLKFWVFSIDPGTLLTVGGYITVSIYAEDLGDRFDIDGRRYPGQKIAEGKVNFSTLTSIGASTISGTTYNKYEVNVGLDEPAVCAAGRYFVSFKRETASIVQSYLIGQLEGFGGHVWYDQNYNLTSGQWRSTEDTDDREPFAQLFGVDLDDYPTPNTVPNQTVTSEISSTGLGHSQFRASRRTGGSLTKPILNDLDLIVEVDGLKDSSTGEVTGTNNKQIITAQDAIAMLCRKWNGSTWGATNFDYSKFSASHAAAFASTGAYYRKIAGKTSGRAVAKDLIAELARNSNSRVVSFPGGASSVGVYAWGAVHSVVKTFTDEETELVGVQYLGTSTIINQVLMAYANRLTGIDVKLSTSDGRFKNYNGIIDSAARGLNQLSTTRSQSIYGFQELANNTYDWIDDESSAIANVRALLAQFQVPRILVTFRVPYFGNEDLDPMDVVRLTSPGIPAFFGTNPEARYPINTANNAAVDLTRGHYWKRAQSRLLQITGLDLQYNENSPSLLTVTGQVLDYLEEDNRV